MRKSESNGKGALAFESAMFAEKYLLANKWRYARNVDVRRVSFDGYLKNFKNIDQPIRFVLVARERYLAGMAYYPIDVPSKLRRSICELMTLANAHMIFGHFEMDMDSGRMRFRVVHDWASLSKCQDRDACMKRLLYLPANMLDKYWKGFEAVVARRKTPKAAYQEVVRSFVAGGR